MNTATRTKPAPAASPAIRTWRSAAPPGGIAYEKQGLIAWLCWILSVGFWKQSCVAVVFRNGRTRARITRATICMKFCGLPFVRWVPDVTMNEDASRNRKDLWPQNPTLLRRMALNVARPEGSRGSTKAELKRAVWDDAFLMTILKTGRADLRSPCPPELAPCKPGNPLCNETATERWPSGRRRTPGKCVGGEPSRGFESLSVRHLPLRNCSPDRSLGGFPFCFQGLCGWS